jgi:hypothetical protein
MRSAPYANPHTLEIRLKVAQMRVFTCGKRFRVLVAAGGLEKRISRYWNCYGPLVPPAGWCGTSHPPTNRANASPGTTSNT